MANIDPLTSAGNRRALNQKLDSVRAILRRNNAPGSLLILDVDHFKRINDAYGHIAGDQVLVDIADLVRSATRATESLYRYGGEEFVVVAELTGLEAATKLAENLREKIERRVLSAGIKLTVSIGVAELQRGEERETWLGRADAVLFQAKGQGRNRVVVSQAPEVEAAVFPVGVPSALRHSS
jgi:diguanylate cyclase (GGDEF)-like protein